MTYKDKWEIIQALKIAVEAAKDGDINACIRYIRKAMRHVEEVGAK